MGGISFARFIVAGDLVRRPTAGERKGFPGPDRNDLLADKNSVFLKLPPMGHRCLFHARPTGLKEPFAAGLKAFRCRVRLHVSSSKVIGSHEVTQLGCYSEMSVGELHPIDQ